MIRAIVTGASSGIGRATVEALIEASVEVVAAARSIEKLRDLEGKCDIHLVDVRFESSCTKLVRTVSGTGIRVPVVINAAGIAFFGPFVDEDDEFQAVATDNNERFENRCEETLREFERDIGQIRTNLIGPMNMAKAAIPWMLSRGSGHIVNVVSIAATNPFSGAAAYCASKAGLLMFGKCLAAEYRSRGIRVTSILPGSTDTPLWDRQSFVPNREEMLSPRAVAECIRDVILSPTDRSFDEIVLMPPKGIL